ncbi:hypothetical protein [Limnoglobus roseus]|uniref:Uncharacterized protein n=1 Tax=Limnoglobus roseus TaxID=2598579 RepID=A0A5C1AKA5_9BACT|nr:hypothetical protein [Limnoglobus roseus]QEL18436.1 hypothetical protein PX52LOC_05461 [Limnoglobus roseus]
MSVRVVCPFCNAVVEGASEGRTACPRCSESFDAATAEPAAEDAVTASPATTTAPGFLYSRTAVFLSLGLAAAILGVGLSIIRPWESRTPPRQEVKLPVVVSPLGLSGLTYLPARTNVVAAIQPMPLLAYAAQNKIDPRRFLIESGVPEAVLSKLSQAGVPLDQIDHVVVGAAVGSEAGKSLPTLTACLKLTRPLADETKFLTQLKAEKSSQESKGGRTVYAVQLGLPLYLTRVDDLTYLLAFSDTKDFALIDKPMPAGGGHLPAQLREAMTSKISPASFAWLATDSEPWTEKDAVKLLLTVNAALKNRFANLTSFRAIAVGLSMEPDPQLRLGIRTADPAATAATQTFLKDKFTGDGVAFNGDPEWAVVQMPFDPKTTPLKAILSEWMNAKP